MSRRRHGLLASLAVASTSLAVVAPGPASAAACGTVESVLMDGAAVPVEYELSVTCDALGGSQDVRWNVTKNGSYDLGAAARTQVWSMRIDTGNVVPRVTSTHGGAVTVERSRTGDGHWHVDISAKPVLMLGECDQSVSPWTCPSVATQQWDGLLSGEITDYGSWEDAAQRAAFYGMDFASNIAASTIPPQIVADSVSGADMISLELANPHFLKSDPTQVFKGYVKTRIPNAFLKEVYGVDSPASLTSAGLAPTLSGSGSGSLTVVDTGTALVVYGTDMSFSRRVLRVHRGTITPTRPTGLTTRRTGSTTAKLSFTASKSRGAKVTGYQARCTARVGTHVVTDTETNTPPQYISGLRRGVAYDCKVRGTSKAGPGPYTAVVRLSAKVA